MERALQFCCPLRIPRRPLGLLLWSAMGAKGSKCVGPGRAPPGSQEEDQGEEAALMEASGASLLHVLAQKGDCEGALQLLSKGPKETLLRRQDSSGRTPLFWATENRQERMAALLLEHGADPGARDHAGNLCLHRAAFVGSVRLSRLLLDAGSELDAPNARGERPSALARRQRRSKCLALLLSLGASSSPKDPPPRLLCRDISRGLEALPIPCLNGVDEEAAPGDFQYVTQSLLSDTAEAPPEGWARRQHCSCGPGCPAPGCPCLLRSGRSAACYSPEGRLLLLDADATLCECHLLCSCGAACANRVAQGRLRTQLQLFRSAKRGWAVRAMQDLAPGAFLCQYFGELVSEEEARRKEEEEGAAPGYCFLLGAQAGRGCCLDGRRYGNVARFLNHSCRPNLVALPVFTGLEVPGVAFFAGSRGVRAGEELGFDYGDDFWSVQRSRGISCHCGEAACRFSDTLEAPPPLEAPPRGFAFKTLRAPPIAGIQRNVEKERGLVVAPPPATPAGQ